MIRVNQPGEFGPVECTFCAQKKPHYWHFYGCGPGLCTCAAAGCYEDHSSHCDLYNRELIRDDSLIVPHPDDRRERGDG